MAALQPEAGTICSTTEENLPPLDYEPPVPIVARAGQASVLTTALVHGASNNVDTRPRYACHLSYNSADLEIPLPASKHQVRRDYLRPERLHLVS